MTAWAGGCGGVVPGCTGGRRPRPPASPPACERAALADRLVELITTIEPALSATEVLAAIDAAMPSTLGRRQAVALLTGDPAVLTDGRSSTPLPLARLLERLVVIGATAVVLPRCGWYGATRRLPNVRGDQRICNPCRTRASATTCSDCGLVRPVQVRTAAGLALCANCRRKDPARWARCELCAHDGEILSRQEGVARCRRCYQRPERRCDGCGRRARIVSTKQGRRVCRRCYQPPRRRCDGCGRIAEIARQRVPEDPALCRRCLPTIAVCRRCGTRRPCRFVATGRPICNVCLRPREPCSRCGQQRYVAARTAAGPLCSTCSDRQLRAKGACSTCGRLRRLFEVADQAPRCADCAGIVQTSHVCAACGAEDRLVERGRCERCAVTARLDALLRTSDGLPVTMLAPVADALQGANPHSVLGWLRHSDSARLLADLAAGACPLSHEGLDAWGPARRTQFLRDLLVACQLLPWRDPFVARFAGWLDLELSGITDPERRRLLHQFATWRLLRHLRQLADRHQATVGALNAAKQTLRQARAFLAWLAEHDKRLTDCGQADLDAWLAEGPTTRAMLITFVVWSREQRLTPGLRFPSRPPQTSFRTSTEAAHWELIDRLLVDPGIDSSIDAADRVAGCLVLLFAQPVSRVARLRLQDVHLDQIPGTIRLGDTELELPAPLAARLGELVANRQGRHGIDAPQPSGWLFPGGAPGRPITPTHLAKRLRALGIDVRAARNRAVVDLASHLPPSVLADLLGFHRVTAAGWVHRAGADRAGYVAARAAAPADERRS